jgi:hypothetical protein
MANGEYGDFTSVTIRVRLDLKQLEVEASSTEGRDYYFKGDGANSAAVLRTVADKLVEAYANQYANSVRYRVDKRSGTILSDKEKPGGEALAT